MFGEYCNFFIYQWVVGQDNSEGIHVALLRYNKTRAKEVNRAMKYKLVCYHRLAD